MRACQENGGIDFLGKWTSVQDLVGPFGIFVLFASFIWAVMAQI